MGALQPPSVRFAGSRCDVIVELSLMAQLDPSCCVCRGLRGRGFCICSPHASPDTQLLVSQTVGF